MAGVEARSFATFAAAHASDPRHMGLSDQPVLPQTEQALI
jgi:hypothetical protein